MKKKKEKKAEFPFKHSRCTMIMTNTQKDNNIE